jgi:hypothetical protein
MELLSGSALAWQQYRSLLRKNATLTWRHRRSAALQLFSSLVFIFLIFCIDRAVRSRFSSTTAYRNVPDPEALVAPPIPPCEDKFFIKSPCYDFLWSDGGSARVKGLVDAIRRNNPGRPIPAEKVPNPSLPSSSVSASSVSSVTGLSWGRLGFVIDLCVGIGVRFARDELGWPVWEAGNVVLARFV